MTNLDLLQAFTLGAGAILTNACLLPLYPGLLAFLAGTAVAGTARGTAWLGALVFAGVIAAMLIAGSALYLLAPLIGEALPVVLLLAYAIVIVLGALTLAGRSPFARLQVGQVPMLRNRYAAAFAYGLLLGPTTLPCTGSLFASAFLVGMADAGAYLDYLLFFLAFGVGFGFPLILIALAAAPIQRRAVRWLTQHHRLLERASGVLLIAVGVFGLLTEFAPRVTPGFILQQSAWIAYWIAVAVLIIVIAVGDHRSRTQQAARDPL